jgi:hypothetical protein
MNVQNPVLNYGDIEPPGIVEKINEAFDALSASIRTLDDDLKHLELQRRADKTRIIQLEQTVKMLEQDAIDPVTPELDPTGYEDVANDKLIFQWKRLGEEYLDAIKERQYENMFREITIRMEAGLSALNR